ncbi:MAG: ABC transporter ATP-binding protein [Atopobiaceae bacterium]|jgi:ABC-type uncharacterized transport system ATPase subunit
MSIIKTIGLTKRFGDFTANDSIDLSVDEREIRCIVGENGAGKTTLMNMLYGLLAPTEGQIFIHDEFVQLAGPKDAIAHGLGMVHQHFKLVPSLTVYENVLLGAEIVRPGISHLIDTKQEIEVVQNLIEQYHFGLDPLERIEDISVGAQQRVEILKMLYRNVDVIILDEPTAVLTPQEVDGLIVSLKDLREQGKTIIMITHKLREVMELSDSVTVIRRGKIVGDVLTKDTNQSELACMMVGHEVTHVTIPSDAPQPSSEVALHVSSLSTTNEEGKEVLKGVEFSVHKGEILGVAGVEGNGQSELSKVLTGLMTTTSGAVEILGKDVTGWWPDQLRKAGLAIIPEDRFEDGLCATMSVAENSVAGYLDNNDVTHHGMLNHAAMCARRDYLVKEYEILVGDLKGNVGQLSGGNAQKLIVGRELESGGKVLVACQPTRGVDLGAAEDIHRRLLDFRNTGGAVLLISSELSEVMGLSDRVIVMYKGEVVGEVDPQRTSSTEVGLLMAGIRGDSHE